MKWIYNNRRGKWKKKGEKKIMGKKKEINLQRVLINIY